MRLNVIKHSHRNPERAGWRPAVVGEGGHITNTRGVACYWQDGNEYQMLQFRIQIRTYNLKFENSTFV